MNNQFGLARIGCIGGDVEYASRSAAAEERVLWTFQHLNARHIEQLRRRRRRIAQCHAINHDANARLSGLGVLRNTNAANLQGGWLILLRGECRDRTREVLNFVQPLVLQLCCGNHRNGHRDRLDGFGALGGGHHHL